MIAYLLIAPILQSKSIRCAAAAVLLRPAKHQLQNYKTTCHAMSLNLSQEHT